MLRSSLFSQSELSSIYAGVMSGTSMDGVDAILARFEDERVEILSQFSITYPATLREHLLQLQTSDRNELHHAALLANQLADLYAESLIQLCTQTKLNPEQICAAGVHGQTIRHRPECGYTLQLNQPARIAERSHISIVADFRSRDIAAGGQGAPLVPAFHATIFRQQSPSAVLNMGGIANLTLLHGDKSIFGFDTGPGNILLDAWIQRHQQQPFDRDGAWAAQGNINQNLLASLLSDPYFQLPAPKSTGRDLFNLTWLEDRLERWKTLSAVDIQATLLAFTAHSICQALIQNQPETETVIVCGGGAYNLALMRQLQALLPQINWQLSDRYHIAPEWVEALAFAWLARQCILGLPGNIPTVTGATGERILGAIYLA